MKRIVNDIVYPNPIPPGVKLEKNVYATMRDGVKIALDIYKPSNEKGPWPVILAYSPFPKERIFESAKPGFYCSYGYVSVVIFNGRLKIVFNNSGIINKNQYFIDRSFKRLYVVRFKGVP